METLPGCNVRCDDFRSYRQSRDTCSSGCRSGCGIIVLVALPASVVGAVIVEIEEGRRDCARWSSNVESTARLSVLTPLSGCHAHCVAAIARIPQVFIATHCGPANGGRDDDSGAAPRMAVHALVGMLRMERTAAAEEDADRWCCCVIREQHEHTCESAAVGFRLFFYFPAGARHCCYPSLLSVLCLSDQPMSTAEIDPANVLPPISWFPCPPRDWTASTRRTVMRSPTVKAALSQQQRSSSAAASTRPTACR